MTEDTNRGYTVPLPANPRKTIQYVAFGAVMLLAAAFSYVLLGEPGPGVPGAKIRAARMLWPLLLLILLWELLRCTAKLRIAPRGIVISWGSWTLDGVPTERIVLLAGVYRKYRCYLAVCGRTPEELAEMQAVEMSQMFQDARTTPGWTEKMASQYLCKQSAKLFRHSQPILWLEWSPERLEMLQTMYPNALWLDTTPDKRLDRQMNH